MTIVWYVLIHVSLGLIGSDLFRFTNLGALYCIAASAVVQGYAMWEMHRGTWPMFLASLDEDAAPATVAAARRGYWNRLGRVFIFRVSAFGILTLLIASLVRGAGA